jgi:hypothetical protein
MNGNDKLFIQHNFHLDRTILTTTLYTNSHGPMSVNTIPIKSSLLRYVHYKCFTVKLRAFIVK